MLTHAKVYISVVICHKDGVEGQEGTEMEPHRDHQDHEYDLE